MVCVGVSLGEKGWNGSRLDVVSDVLRCFEVDGRGVEGEGAVVEEAGYEVKGLFFGEGGDLEREDDLREALEAAAHVVELVDGVEAGGDGGCGGEHSHPS